LHFYASKLLYQRHRQGDDNHAREEEFHDIGVFEIYSFRLDLIQNTGSQIPLKAFWLDDELQST
jgi:hypothetical protein